MKRSIFTITLAFLLALVIGFSAVPVHVSAATNTESAKQKKAAKKYYKYINNLLESNITEDNGWAVSYKKTGKKYTFTIVSISSKLSADHIYNYTIKSQNYPQIINSLKKLSKNQLKIAKKQYKLKNPVIKVVWRSCDGQKIVTINNGMVEYD